LAKTQSNNVLSIRALEKAGLKKEDIMCDYHLSRSGKRYNAIILSILRGEFAE